MMLGRRRGEKEEEEGDPNSKLGRNEQESNKRKNNEIKGIRKPLSMIQNVNTLNFPIKLCRFTDWVLKQDASFVVSME